MINLKLIFICALIFSVSGICAEQVRMLSTVATSITGTTSGTLILNHEGPSGDGTSESAPAKVYLPIQNSNTNSNSYYITSRKNALASIFDINNSNHLFNVPLKVSTDANARYLYVAAKNQNNEYKVIRLYSSTAIPGNSSNAEITFPVSAQDICKVMTSNCGNLVPTSTSASDNNFFVYFFLSANAYVLDGSQTITVSSENNGIYYQVYMSNRIFPASSITTAITQARPGDKRAVLTYSASAGLGSYAKSVRVFSHEPSPSAAKDLPFGEYDSGSLIAEVYDYKQAGEMTVTGLVNETTYHLSVLLVDKFNFATTLSDVAIVRPKTIEELLKAQSCFLLTAGFGEEHYVIDYFRSFRDKALMKSYIGRSFVNFYYLVGPKLAMFIYPHDSLRAIVRGGAYATYFLFTHLLEVIFVLFSVLLSQKLNHKLRKS